MPYKLNISIVVKHLLLVLILVSGSIAFSQESLKFEHLSIRDGLSDNIVTDIIQDQYGFLWFGTYKGLNRFDGYEFKQFQFSEEDSTSIQANMISCLYEDRDGYIWVGSFSNGLGRYNPWLGHFDWFDEGSGEQSVLTNHSIRVMYEDENRHLWIGTEYGLSVLDSSRNLIRKFVCTTGNCTEGLNGKTIYDMVEDRQGRIWFATENNQLSVYDKITGSFTYVTYTDLELPDKDHHVLKNLYIHNDSVIWVGSNHGGLSKLVMHSGEYKSYSFDGTNKGPSSHQIRDILSFDGKLWLATDGAGLDLFDPVTETFSNYQKSQLDPYSISSNVLWKMYKDQQGIIWIATYQGGISKFDFRNNIFQLITNDPTSSNTIPNNPVLSLLEDKNQNLWIGTDWGGLHSRDHKGNYQMMNEENVGLELKVIKSIEASPDGKILLGSYNEGLSILDPFTKTTKKYKREKDLYPNLASNHIWDIYVDSKGLVWLGTLGGGIIRFMPETETFENIPYEYSTGGQLHIYHILEDAKSNLWFSTDDGIIKLNRRLEQWEYYQLDDFIPGTNHEVNQVKSVYEDQYHVIWMATSAGLVKYDQKSEDFTLLNESINLPELPLMYVTDDTYGNLLLISRTFITHFDPVKETTTAFRVNDNVLNYNAMVKRKNGDVVVGGVQGITVFSARSLRQNDHIPRVHLTDIQLFNRSDQSSQSFSKPIEQTASINLNYDQNVITISFTALNYTESDRNQYAYQMEGFDENWNYLSTRKSVTYTNLDPGTYTFKVKASNNHGIWNESGASIQINIKPPYWSTWWFKVGNVTIIVIIAILIIRFRFNQLKAKLAYEQLKNNQDVISLKNEQLEQQLQSTRSELNNITMSYIHKNQKLQQIRTKIDESAQQINGQEKRLLTKVVKDIDKEMRDEDYWDKFEYQFNQSHDNFLERFKKQYPDLSKRELRVCAYLRMGLDNQEIATLMNVTVRTIETSRYRIRKKIQLEERQSFTKMILRF